ncbi:AAA family ATPase [Hyalangium gracile]|uniref:AAA family ATPase n=1 Tax=Hyalangium gracile TaxID=394092 RepID=UPI001CCE4197|nr:AAA family ATPase [Hyalangium gracile]
MALLESDYLDQLEQAATRIPDAAEYARAEAMIQSFQKRFPPDRLRRLEGMELLEELHGREGRDCLAYWLEFRDDEQFRAQLFGSIRGGSALKFGIYQRAEDGGWYQHGGEAATQRKLSLDEAISIAEQQRDQFLAAREVIAALPTNPDSEAYRRLQERIQKAAPDLFHLAFLHKYLFLQFPDRIDDYHSVDHQVHHLLQMGSRPPEEGLYSAAGLFVSAWQQLRERRPLGMPLFTHLLNTVNGTPFHTWRIGTREGNTGESQWAKMIRGSYVSVGWPALGDLHQVVAGRTGSDAKEAIREALARHYPTTIPQQRGKETNQLWSFFQRIQEGDQIFAADGQTILAIGRVKGPYYHVPGEVFPHQRSVEWLSQESFASPDRSGLQTTVYRLDNAYDVLLAGVRHLRRVKPPAPPPKPPPPLEKILGRIDEELRRKGQVVLYGPPGTGKTWHALRAAEELAARGTFGRSKDELSEAQRSGLRGMGEKDAQRIWMCTFHPAYGYEEFVEGLRPQTVSGTLGFEPRPGLFRRVCASARKNPQQPHFLLIDEFNRGDVARIFGELLTLLELDKRGKVSIELPFSGERFTVPPNVLLIATMNTADRSIALLDSALRRRFGFIELLPDPEVLATAQAGRVMLRPLLKKLNERLVQHLRHDARNLQVGHSFFQRDGSPLSDFADLRRVLRHEIVPLLQEYCYDQPELLRQILGEKFLASSSREIWDELFTGTHDDALLTALESWDPSIIVSEARDADDASGEGEDAAEPS